MIQIVTKQRQITSYRIYIHIYKQHIKRNDNKVCQWMCLVINFFKNHASCWYDWEICYISNILSTSNIDHVTSREVVDNDEAFF